MFVSFFTRKSKNQSGEMGEFIPSKKSETISFMYLHFASSRQVNLDSIIVTSFLRGKSPDIAFFISAVFCCCFPSRVDFIFPFIFFSRWPWFHFPTMYLRSTWSIKCFLYSIHDFFMTLKKRVLWGSAFQKNFHQCNFMGLIRDNLLIAGRSSLGICSFL